AAREEDKESSVPVDIYIEDVNDNIPRFLQPLYTATAKENIGSGEPIVQVQATDKDAGRNGRIVYSVDDSHFMVNERGEISARLRLDADQNRERFHIYRFNITAADYGEPQLKSTAMVHIRTENANDEAPRFIPTAEYTASVAEDAQGGTPVVQIQAVDADHDQVTYSFVDEYEEEALSTRMFEIDKDTGLIRLRPHVKPLDILQYSSPYNLTVIARDDGSCCEGVENKRSIHTSRANVRIFVADVNNHRPEFPHCAEYKVTAKIREGSHEPNEKPIIKVEATDKDSGANGEITYSLYYARSETRKPFVIDAESGELRPSTYYVFDRETRPFEEVTVKATDKGDRPLIGFCQFLVQVTDVNDETPQFERDLYETTISRNTAAGFSVFEVRAEDRDHGDNARITYALLPDETAPVANRNDYTQFELRQGDNYGEVVMSGMPHDRDRFVFLISATDHGVPPRVATVQAIVHVREERQAVPQWVNDPSKCPQYQTVNETTQINFPILRCSAISGDGSGRPISYKMTNNVKIGANGKQKFREFNEKRDGKDWVVVRLMEPLDFTQASEYTLTLTATDMKSLVPSDKQFTIRVRDENNAVPRFTVDKFTGTIDEELTPAEYMAKFDGEPVTVVTAEDADEAGSKASEIHYRILEDPSAAARRLFRIEEVTGKVFPLEKFDRELNDSFIFDVEACDAAQSALPGNEGPNCDIVKVHIFVNDVNDNPSFFEQSVYEARVAENAEVYQDILTVKAHDLDKDSNLRYDLYSEDGQRIPFGVKTDSGVVFVKEPLDFEKESSYQLRLMVTDGKHNTTTDLRILVTDVNDNAPKFERALYETTVVEEDSKVPKVLFVVKAYDADKEVMNGRIVYRLEGQGVGEFFQIDELSGEIVVLRPLDRDPPTGIPLWKFIVQAVDNDGRGLVGYADVQVNVKDVNDNAPHFPSDMYGSVEENRDPEGTGVYVMTVEAKDDDDPRTDNARLEYSIRLNKEIDGEPLFRIERENGKLFCMKKLDRESIPERQFTIEVAAVDQGFPPNEAVANVTIAINDVNDNPPFWPKELYEVS
ncbi:CBR-HMR-1 protein, partial [Aphelenchoides avenae]